MCRVVNLIWNFADPFIYINSYLFIILFAPFFKTLSSSTRRRAGRCGGEMAHFKQKQMTMCSAENGNEIHVKFITSCGAVAFEKWMKANLVTERWGAGSGNISLVQDAETVCVGEGRGGTGKGDAVCYIDFIFLSSPTHPDGVDTPPRLARSLFLPCTIVQNTKVYWHRTLTTCTCRKIVASWEGTAREKESDEKCHSITFRRAPSPNF